jgi:hypothetical protein
MRPTICSILSAEYGQTNMRADEVGERKGSTVASDGTQGVQVNTTLIGTGAVLALLGSLLIALGMALGGTAVIAAAREWARLQETPPSQVARLKLQQLRTAASAGADAWRSGQSPS